MPKRKLEETEKWNLRKDTILGYYINENKHLADVIQIMASQGFKRTKPQYERTFREWGITKNVKEEEWKFIIDRLDERDLRGEASMVKVRGIAIPEKKLQRQRKKQRISVFDCIRAQMAPCPRSLTPPGVEVYTPPSSPSLGHGTPQENDHSGSFTNPIYFCTLQSLHRSEVIYNRIRGLEQHHIQSTPRSHSPTVDGPTANQDGDETEVENTQTIDMPCIIM